MPKGLTDEEMFGASDTKTESKGLTDEEMFAGDTPSIGLTDEEMFGTAYAQSDSGGEEDGRVKYTPAESAAMGARSGALFDLYDEGSGAVKAGFDVLTGDAKIADIVETYKKYRDEEREKERFARRDNPKSYMAGTLGGGLASSFIPGIGWLNAGKKAGMLGVIGKGALSGGVAGFGTSEGENASEIMGDVQRGTLIGGIGAGTLRGVGNVYTALKPRTAAKLGANIMLNTPEELTELAIQRGRSAIEKAPLRADVAKRYQSTLDDLKRMTIEGSQGARKQIRGVDIDRDEVADIAKHLASKAKKRSEGVTFSGPKKAGISMLEEVEQRFRPRRPPPVESTVDGSRLQTELQDFLNKKKGIKPQVVSNDDFYISGNRLKDEIQDLDLNVDYDIGAGKFAKADSGMVSELRQELDSLLKGKSPEYAEEMIQVAKDASLLDKANRLGSDKTLANIFRRVVNDEWGAGVFPREIIEQVDERMGTNLLDQAKLALAREAFDKSITNGSMNVNKFSNWLRDVPVLGYAAPLIGASVDKYGRKMTLAAVDAAHYLETVGRKYGVQQMQKDMRPFIDLAKKGNKPAALTLAIMAESDDK